ncbi:hypothetical protein R3P38DRAFT_2793792 [Favolaschia claudopus]|uniref:Uncharacterized protein n=1 Tax=Favolaschia claudopus TaxID=2862362 RepID=A0AAW0ACY2_9AGAR
MTRQKETRDGVVEGGSGNRDKRYLRHSIAATYSKNKCTSTSVPRIPNVAAQRDSFRKAELVRYGGDEVVGECVKNVVMDHSVGWRERWIRELETGCRVGVSASSGAEEILVVPGTLSGRFGPSNPNSQNEDVEEGEGKTFRLTQMEEGRSKIGINQNLRMDRKSRNPGQGIPPTQHNVTDYTPESDHSEPSNTFLGKDSNCPARTVRYNFRGVDGSRGLESIKVDSVGLKVPFQWVEFYDEVELEFDIRGNEYHVPVALESKVARRISIDIDTVSLRLRAKGESFAIAVLPHEHGNAVRATCDDLEHRCIACDVSAFCTVAAVARPSDYIAMNARRSDDEGSGDKSQKRQYNIPQAALHRASKRYHKKRSPAQQAVSQALNKGNKENITAPAPSSSSTSKSARKLKDYKKEYQNLQRKLRHARTKTSSRQRLTCTKPEPKTARRL